MHVTVQFMTLYKTAYNTYHDTLQVIMELYMKS